MENKNIMVSIIIPSYNRLATLINTVKSILEQNNDQYEVIVVDDGSTDGTPDILKKTFNNISIISTQIRKGPSYARNIGISKSNGKYIWFLDSDVILPDKNMLDRMIAAFNSKPDIGSLGGEIVVHESLTDRTYGRKITWDVQSKRISVSPEDDMVTCDYLATCNCFTMRDLVIKVGGFDERFVFGAEDMDLGLKLQKIGLTNYVRHDLAVHHFHEATGRYENETAHYQKTRMIFAKKHYRKSRLFSIFIFDIFKVIKFYMLLPIKLIIMVLLNKNVTRQNVMGGWDMLRCYFTTSNEKNM